MKKNVVKRREEGWRQLTMGASYQPVSLCARSVNSVNIRALSTHLAALGQSESSSPQDDESPGHLLLHDLPVQQGR